MSQNKIPGKYEAIKLADIEKKIPFDVVVRVQVAISRASNILKRGNDYQRPVIVSLNGKLYAVSEIETIQAAKQLGMKTLECEVKSAHTMDELLQIHIHRSKSLTLNPITMMKVTKKIEESGGNMDVIPVEYRKLHQLDIDESVKEMISSLLKTLSEQREEIPSLVHIFRPLAGIEKSQQRCAFSSLLKYCFGSGPNFIPPDSTVIGAAFAKYTKVRPTKKAIMVNPIEKFDEPAKPKPVDDVEINFHKNTGDMGTKVGTANVIDLACKCKRTYSVNLKNGTVKELKENSASITAVEVESGQWFKFPESGVETLELDLRPVVYKYSLGSGVDGVFIVSRNQISKKKLADMKKMVS